MVFFMVENLDPNNKGNDELSDDTIKSNVDELKQSKAEQDVIMNENNSAPKIDLKNENNTQVKTTPKPKKELPIEKKPFQEFINVHFERAMNIFNRLAKNLSFLPIPAEESSASQVPPTTRLRLIISSSLLRDGCSTSASSE